MYSPGIVIAFFAGVLSVASPCILPIIPSFMGYITGVSLSDGYSKLHKKVARRKLFINTLIFGAGFSLVFLMFGAVIGVIGQTLVLNRPIFQTIGGIIIIFFGLQLTGLINLKFLMKEKKLELSPKLKKMEYLRLGLGSVLRTHHRSDFYARCDRSQLWTGDDAFLLLLARIFGAITALYVLDRPRVPETEKIPEIGEIHFHRRRHIRHTARIPPDDDQLKHPGELDQCVL